MPLPLIPLRNARTFHHPTQFPCTLFGAQTRHHAFFHDKSNLLCLDRHMLLPYSSVFDDWKKSSSCLALLRFTPGVVWIHSLFLCIAGQDSVI